MKFELSIPGHPPSVNRVWRNVGRARFIKAPEYIAWEKAVLKVCTRFGNIPQMRAFVAKPYRLEIELWSQTWRTKRKTIRRPDTPNCIKAAEDAVCSFYGWEDSWNLETSIKKLEGKEDHTVIRFQFLSEHH